MHRELALRQRRLDLHRLQLFEHGKLESIVLALSPCEQRLVLPDLGQGLHGLQAVVVILGFLHLLVLQGRQLLRCDLGVAACPDAFLRDEEDVRQGPRVGHVFERYAAGLARELLAALDGGLRCSFGRGSLDWIFFSAGPPSRAELAARPCM